MKSLIDRGGRLSQGLAHIRIQFGVPVSFPAQVLAEAQAAAALPIAHHADRRGPSIVVQCKTLISRLFTRQLSTEIRENPPMFSVFFRYKLLSLSYGKSTEKRWLT
jgi:hypothetical protein